MPSRDDVHYFGAGPAPLPTPVLEDAARALLNYNDLGIGLTEISHRSADATKILADAKASLTTLLDIPSDYDILFLQGGGSGEFSAVVYHMVAYAIEQRRKGIEEELRQEGGDPEQGFAKSLRTLLHGEIWHELRLDYLVTGSWSLKASQEAARLIGADNVNIALDARKYNDGKFGVIPPESEWNLTHINEPYREGAGTGPAMVYYCDNETVDGVEFPAFPKCLENCPFVVADMSSNFLSRRVDVRKYAVIFGGAQKNVGNAGITIVIARKDLLAPGALAAAPLLREYNMPVGPVVLDWPTMAKNDSLYNTLPSFDVWIAGQVVRRLVERYGQEGLGGQERVAGEKAGLVYRMLDKYENVYRVVPDRSVRSRMNICFRLGDADEEKEFLKGAEKSCLLGLKGHRSVGGIRASNYNAVSVQSVEELVQYLEEYAQTQ